MVKQSDPIPPYPRPSAIIQIIFGGISNASKAVLYPPSALEVLLAAKSVNLAMIKTGKDDGFMSCLCIKVLAVV